MRLLSTSISPERFFLAAGLCFGLLYFVFVPPFQSPDEFNHFYRAFQIAEGGFLPEKLPDRLGGHLPQSLNDFYNTFRFAEITPLFRFKVNHLTETFLIPIDSERRVFCDFANTSNYSLVSYLPQSLVIALLRLFGASLGLIYYAGRLVTLLLWLTAVYYSIRNTPVFKWLLVFVALLPTNLYIASSFSADNVTNMLAFLWISHVFRLVVIRDRITKKDLAALVILASALALAKLVYVGLIILILIIPKDRFRSNIHKVASYLWVSVPAMLLALLWAKLISGNHISYNDYDPEFRVLATLSPGSDFAAQLNVILSDVTYFPRVIFNSIFNPFQFYLHSYIGAFGTHLYHHLPAWAWISAYLVILYAAATSEIRAIFSGMQRLVLFIAFLVSFMLVLLTNHLYWDPVGSGYVGLVQGRYLIPLFPLLFIIVGDFVSRGKLFSVWPLIFMTVILNGLAVHLIFKTYFLEPYSRITVARTGFEELSAGSFTSSDPSIQFSDQNNSTALEKRRGSRAAMAAPYSPYTAGFVFPHVAYLDVIEFEVWRKGKTGIAVLDGDEQNCNPYMIQLATPAFRRKDGWEKMHCWFQNTDSCNNGGAVFYLYNLSPDTVYFDDLTLRHRKREDLVAE